MCKNIAAQLHFSSEPGNFIDGPINLMSGPLIYSSTDISAGHPFWRRFYFIYQTANQTSIPADINAMVCQTTVKILKIGTPEIITIIVLQLEQLDFTVQYCVQKMQTEQQTEKTLIRLLHEEQSDLGLHCLLRPICPNI